MSKGEVVFTTAAAAALACLALAGVCAWMVVTDPASLIPAASGADAFIATFVRVVVRMTTAALSLVGW